MNEEPPGDPDVAARDEDVAARAYGRRFRDKGNKREDWAIDVFREVFARLDEPARVDRLLFDLGRYYNALTNAPIVDLATRRRVADCLSRGAKREAEALVRTCLERYRGGIDDGLDRSDL
ncbi:MAG: hypothetical protein FJZ38_12610 [Candidatus Rokubacteria bacterium]|nr:hypothetical protein [Candidatus Rokubacteria bacterium]